MRKKNTENVVFRLNPSHPPRMTADEIRALSQKPDSDLDYSEIPPLQGRLWKKPGDLVSTENKQQITLRLDADVVAFFRSTGRRYQSRMNAVLREYVIANSKASRRSA
jgi:uncharacterized protein (DUF4415 family)